MFVGVQLPQPFPVVSPGGWVVVVHIQTIPPVEPDPLKMFWVPGKPDPCLGDVLVVPVECA